MRNDGSSKLTFSGIGVYHPRLFDGCQPGKFSVVPLLRSAMENHLVTGEEFPGGWDDIGTLERLETSGMEDQRVPDTCSLVLYCGITPSHINT